MEKAFQSPKIFFMLNNSVYWIKLPSLKIKHIETPKGYLLQDFIPKITKIVVLQFSRWTFRFLGIAFLERFLYSIRLKFSPDWSGYPFGHFCFASSLKLGFCPKDKSGKRENGLIKNGNDWLQITTVWFHVLGFKF